MLGEGGLRFHSALGPVRKQAWLQMCGMSPSCVIETVVMCRWDLFKARQKDSFFSFSGMVVFVSISY